MVAEFKTDLARGQDAERRVLEYLNSNGHQAFPATADMQQRGIDIHGFADGAPFTLEVKADHRANKTGNAFVELQHRGWMGATPGWARICQADWVLYLVIKPNGPDEGLLICPKDIAANLDRWVMSYPRATVTNAPRKQKGQDTATPWSTVGVLVPLAELRRISEVIQLDHERSP